ncbi:MAG: leucine-rich repeat protein [Clostridia bacterium]|nr:leucine-rich repeat protein [Clostridia bacterium]
MKKTLSILITLIILLTALPVRSSAAAVPVLRIECEYDGAKSCIARVSAYLDNCAGLAAGAFQLTWDGDDLRYIKAEAGDNGGIAAVDAVGNTVGHSVVFTGVCKDEKIELFTVSFGVKRACSATFELSSSGQLYGVKTANKVSVQKTFSAPEGGMPYYITSRGSDGSLTLDGVITDRSALKVPAVINGEKLTAIGVGAFENMKELKSVVLPEGLVSIGSNAFSGCEWLKTVRFPSSLTTIGSHAFNGCRKLNDVRLPEALHFLGSNAFRGCASLSEIELPQGLTYLGDRVFSGCASLAKAELRGVKYVSVGLFEYCVSLTDVKIPDDVTVFGDRCFTGCSALKSPELPASLTEIGEYAFSYCSAMTSIVIPDSVKSIGEKAFVGCASLAEIRVSSGNLRFEDDAGKALYTADRRELIFVVSGAGLKEYTAAATTEMIDPEAFAENKTLEKVSLPAKIYDIGADAFRGCSALREIAVASGGKNCYIKDGALYTSYTDYTGGVRVSLICLPAVCGKEEFTVPAEVNMISPHALTGVSSIKKFYVDPQNTSFKADSAGALYDFEKTEMIAYPPASEKTAFDLPNNVRTVRADAFFGSGNLTAINSKSMYFKDNDGVLYTGDKLTLVAYPGGRTAAGYQIPANVEYIADGAFSGAESVGKLVLPKTLISVGEGSFYRASLGSAVYDGSRDAWESVEIGRRNEELTGKLSFSLADEEPADLIPAHPDPEYVLGDVNGDGAVKASDARLTLRVSAKLETLDETAALAADVNGDGRINSADARLILRVAAKLQSF